MVCSSSSLIINVCKSTCSISLRQPTHSDSSQSPLSQPNNIGIRSLIATKQTTITRRLAIMFRCRFHASLLIAHLVCQQTFTEAKVIPTTSPLMSRDTEPAPIITSVPQSPAQILRQNPVSGSTSRPTNNTRVSGIPLFCKVDSQHLLTRYRIA
jgi:hypothetical protein